jgi:hypothetical protein
VRARFPVRGVLLGALLFVVFFAVLLFAGDLSSSKFLYVDF